PNKKVRTIAIAARPKDASRFVAATPCGACRQVMTEYENKQNEPITVLMQADGDKIYRVHTVKDLLPLQFSKESLFQL
ncbi:MAG: cytidine deaminase, partial [Hymenobacteraceae bacterium]|nr:cytidine deaminase [Hymenobacteraceae bacterium]